MACEVNIMALMAERKIKEAMEEGQFDNLPGWGRPQKLEDLSHLPDDLRLAYILLKNGGFLDAVKAPNNFRELYTQSTGEAQDCGTLERLKFFLSRSKKFGGSNREAGKNLESISPEYLDKLLKKS